MTKKYTFTGIVQGIGFRPAALRLAKELNLKGEVKNSGGNVTIILQGADTAPDIFVRRLVSMFSIKDYEVQDIEDRHFDGFSIVQSTNDSRVPFITPDIATCIECENELKDKNNRRYHHPFISCVNCGPRYTIINALPYDRERTSMGKFELCSECNDEYTNCTDRRCHAQTVACNNCGPKTNIPVDKAIQILKDGKILAIKDIGGYHLAGICGEKQAKKIRKIKGRETKPFAVMFSSLFEIMEYCIVSEKEKELLTSPARPIVLLKKKKELPKGICNSSDSIGAFLPCNPIQIMILNQVSPLIMTSANISSEPIITDDEEIKKFDVDVISHNRDILTPIDDSIVQINAGQVQFIRRARGYVPLSQNIGIAAKEDILCLGGDLKSAFCFIHKNSAYMSQHFGDLQDEKCFNAFRENIDRFARLHSFNVKEIVADMHPMYNSAHIFKNDILIQHHIAHAYSVVAEHNLKGDILSFVFDGTGYGTDGAVWGGEVFLNKKRVEHLEYTKIIASDEISKNADLALACYDGSNELINKAVEKGINTVNYSGMGRLFDAVCAALDIKHYNTYEGECAVHLEQCAAKAEKEYHLPVTFNPKEIIKAVKNSTAPAEETALGFHIMLCRLILKTAKKYNIKQVTLSGGCFINKILTTNAVKMLEDSGFTVYINNTVPCGDGGIALGQAYLASSEEYQCV